jgi:hypothetical protein
MVSQTFYCIFRRLGKEYYEEVYSLTYTFLIVFCDGMTRRTRCTCVGGCENFPTPDFRLCEYTFFCHDQEGHGLATIK